MLMNNELQNHSFFKTIQRYIEYYDLLSFGMMSYADSPVLGLINLDTYIIENQKSCLESIKIVVEHGHINDAYALLRKYYDNFIINVFERIKTYELEESLEFVSKIIDDWVKGKQKLPSYRVMLGEVMKCEKIASYVLNPWLRDRLFRIRKRCDDHVHNNFFSYMQLNNEVVSIGKEEIVLSILEKDLCAIFCSHYLMLFSFAPHYMASSDYIDYLEVGMTPPEGCQDDVAPFIQEIFDTEIMKWNIDLANRFKENCNMNLN